MIKFNFPKEWIAAVRKAMLLNPIHLNPDGSIDAVAGQVTRFNRDDNRHLAVSDGGLYFKDQFTDEAGYPSCTYPYVATDGEIAFFNEVAYVYYGEGDKWVKVANVEA